MLYVLVLSGKQKKDRQSTSAKICGIIRAICGKMYWLLLNKESRNCIAGFLLLLYQNIILPF